MEEGLAELEDFELPLGLPLVFRRELDFLLLFFPESLEVVPGTLLLAPEFARSVVVLAPVLPGVCGVAAGAGGAFWALATGAMQTRRAGTSKTASLGFMLMAPF